MSRKNYPKLRRIIRESIKTYIKDIDIAGDIAALEAKIGKIGEEVETRRSKLSQVETADFSDLVDQKKLKEINKEIDALEKSREKFQIELDKLNAKNVDTEVDLNTGGDVEEFPEMDANGLVDDEIPLDNGDGSGMGGDKEDPEVEEEEKTEEDTVELNETIERMGYLAGTINEVSYSRRKNKKLLNETRRIQKIAGILNENEGFEDEFNDEDEEAPFLVVNKIENDAYLESDCSLPKPKYQKFENWDKAIEFINNNSSNPEEWEIENNFGEVYGYEDGRWTVVFS